MSTILRRRNIGVSHGRLPSEYQEVEWIGMTGTQYIDTNYYSNTESGYKISANIIATNSYYACLLGTLQTSGTYPYVTLGLGENNNQPKIKCEYGYGAYYFGNVVTLPYNGVFSANYLEDGKFIVNDTILVSSGVSFLDSSTYSVYLFGCNQNGSFARAGSNVRIYSAIFTEGTTIVRNFIPCYRISDSVIGMYDIINDVFYTNAGTGTFTKGGDV